MRRVDLTRRGDKESFLLGTVGPGDYDRVVHAPSALYLDNELFGLLLRPTFSVDPLFDVLADVTMHRNARTGGMYTFSRTFGFRPRSAMHNHCCATCTFSAGHPDVNAQLVALGQELSAQLRHHHPVQWGAQNDVMAANVAERWVMPGTSIFTTGIINKSSSLRYHCDAGNFPGSWNAMLMMRRGMTGGRLVLPEYGVALEPGDGVCCFMDAQATVHGVDDMHAFNADGVRYSVVFFALQAMRHCQSPEEELQRIKRKRTERQRRQHSRERDKLTARLVADRAVKRQGSFREQKERLFERERAKAKK